MIRIVVFRSGTHLVMSKTQSRDFAKDTVYMAKVFRWSWLERAAKCVGLVKEVSFSLWALKFGLAKLGCVGFHALLMNGPVRDG